MRKVFGFLLSFIVWAGVFGQSDDLRLAYRDATKSKSEARDFYNKTKDIKENDRAPMLAYKGAGLVLKARYEPLTKRKNLLKTGIGFIEKAVKEDPKNVEVRLVRLSIQEHLPKIVKYNSQISTDREFIKKSIPTIKDESLLEMVNGYFAEFSK